MRYVLRPGFVLPPLMFSDAEIEALVLGSRWVPQRTDEPLAMAARNTLAKIAAVLPDDLRDTVDASGLLIGPAEPIVTASVDLTVVRQAIQSETRVRITYADARGASSKRTIWPIALAFFERVRVLATWCEERQAFRHFRIDRIAHWDALGALYPRRHRDPRRHRVLMRE